MATFSWTSVVPEAWVHASGSTLITLSIAGGSATASVSTNNCLADDGTGPNIMDSNGLIGPKDLEIGPIWPSTINELSVTVDAGLSTPPDPNPYVWKCYNITNISYKDYLNNEISEIEQGHSLSVGYVLNTGLSASPSFANVTSLPQSNEGNSSFSINTPSGGTTLVAFAGTPGPHRIVISYDGAPSGFVFQDASGDFGTFNVLPARPSGLLATSVPGGVRLTWNNYSQTAPSAIVQYSSNPNFSTPYNTNFVDASDETLDITGLSNQLLYFRARSYENGCYSGWSNTVAAGNVQNQGVGPIIANLPQNTISSVLFVNRGIIGGGNTSGPNPTASFSAVKNTSYDASYRPVKSVVLTTLDIDYSRINKNVVYSDGTVTELKEL